ncbi:hypothetical protein DPX16_1439 [Anabarilius grahami]|uniref:Uncharacterized protein n=1 Tax=Anabarilius grahami TaxID=495550 RepID=A0A3N0YKL6_ANAGA|nr:hypothetical protein DPX16_1439 [Anabarilius grahami]
MCLRPSLQMSGQQMQQIRCLSTAVVAHPVGPVCTHTHTHSKGTNTGYLVMSGLNLCSHTGSAVWWATGEKETSGGRIHTLSRSSFDCTQHFTSFINLSSVFLLWKAVALLQHDVSRRRFGFLKLIYPELVLATDTAAKRQRVKL